MPRCGSKSRDIRQWQQAGPSHYSQFSSFTTKAVEVAVAVAVAVAAAAADILLGPLLVPFFGPILIPK